MVAWWLEASGSVAHPQDAEHAEATRGHCPKGCRRCIAAAVADDQYGPGDGKMVAMDGILADGATGTQVKAREARGRMAKAGEGTARVKATTWKSLSRDSPPLTKPA